MFAKTVKIGACEVGEGRPVLVVAEAGDNHNGDVKLAFRLIEEAARSGVDAVKFQIFRTEELVCRAAPKAAYQNRGDSHPDQFSLLKALELPFAVFPTLRLEAERRGLIFLCSAFGFESQQFLIREVGVPALKIPSGELINDEFLHQACSARLPLILSTGMGTQQEVEDALHLVYDAGCRDLVLLHATSAYPCPAPDVNLRAISTLMRIFNGPVGFSDHTAGNTAPLGAVALGAVLLEKHFTLDRALPGPDHAASTIPPDMKALVAEVRFLEAALGDGVKAVRPAERDVREVARKSWVANESIPKGTVLTRRLLELKRPGTGFPPAALASLAGRRAACDIAVDTLIVPGDLEP